VGDVVAAEHAAVTRTSVSKTADLCLECILVAPIIVVSWSPWSAEMMYAISKLAGAANPSSGSVVILSMG
jgi:hypothetical protein